ncbi:eukaryotic translation initiation factor 3 subunit K-like isoform X2 [Artemia franciscana]|uniref:Eukaryotic translation initiation factor 3 subunit K n=2 Tax=Artemia franciscana TaxID=6661 RepID=A0AA88KY51_ARTSF|nr:hypothetical protein QYM36_016386 [Artemia franciscana]
MVEQMKATVVQMLKGIERYNPENLQTLEHYVKVQAAENAYDLEANLTVLKLYQFTPSKYRESIAELIMLKALTNLPHSDFVLCKCLLSPETLGTDRMMRIQDLAENLERCNFVDFWMLLENLRSLVNPIVGFDDSIRKFICHVIGITYQTVDKRQLQRLLGNISEGDLKSWMQKYGWKLQDDNTTVFISVQDTIKSKNITEKIEFENVAPLMAKSF